MTEAAPAVTVPPHRRSSSRGSRHALTPTEAASRLARPCVPDKTWSEKLLLGTDAATLAEFRVVVETHCLGWTISMRLNRQAIRTRPTPASMAS